MNDSKEKNKRVVGKVIAVIVAFAVMLATSFVVANFVHNRDDSQAVSKVQNGLSAYELAVEQGYDGSVQDWLDSLKGKSAYDIAVENGYFLDSKPINNNCGMKYTLILAPQKDNELNQLI